MIQTQEISITYTGDGQQKSFPYPYPYRSGEDIHGYLVDKYGKETEIQTNFAFNTVENTYTYPVQGDAIPDILRIKLTRETPLQNNVKMPDKLPFSMIEKELDWIIMMLQETIHQANMVEVNKQELNEQVATATNAAEVAEKWAVFTSSPDEAVDTRSPTGKTQSSRSWALTAADQSAAHIEDLKQRHADAVQNISQLHAAAESQLMMQKQESLTALSAAQQHGITAVESKTADILHMVEQEGETQSTQVTTLGTKYVGTMTNLSEQATDAAANAAASQENARSAAEDARAAAQSAGSKALAWNAATTYNYPDVVAFVDGYTYRCVGQNVTGDVPNASKNWVIQTIKSFFDTDEMGDVMPAVVASYDDEWELNEDGDMMPRE